LGRQWVVHGFDLRSPYAGATVMRLRGYDVRVLLLELAEAGEAP
jgi:hypothetical protein